MHNKSGVLLINLGTPAKADAASVKSYLKRFLSDTRVIKTPKIFWKPILHGIILRKRPPVVAKHYQEIWTDAGSPLLVYGQAQQKHLQQLLPDHMVELAMSYSAPFIPDTLEKMLAAGVTDLTVIPLYPQYSGTTVGSVFDAVTAHFRQTDKIINLNFVANFHDHPAYTAFFGKMLKTAITLKRPDAVLFSYHNIPTAYVADGDSYPDQCTRTTELIMQEAGHIPYYQSYQSAFGKGQWLRPYTEDLVKELPAKGIKKLLVVAPGFVADCLETILELDVENRENFMVNGGLEFTYLPTFNDSPALAEILADITTKT